MNNLLPSAVKMHLKYDLKGSTYKRRASAKERDKAVPTFKDLDFIQYMPDGLLMEGDTHSAVCKTIQRDCLVRALVKQCLFLILLLPHLIGFVSLSLKLLQSFKIMDYSLLVGIHNVDQASADAGAAAVDQARPQVQKSLYCTAIEAIQTEPTRMESLDTEDK